MDLNRINNEQYLKADANLLHLAVAEHFMKNDQN